MVVLAIGLGCSDDEGEDVNSETKCPTARTGYTGLTDSEPLERTARGGVVCKYTKSEGNASADDCPDLAGHTVGTPSVSEADLTCTYTTG